MIIKLWRLKSVDVTTNPFSQTYVDMIIFFSVFKRLKTFKVALKILFVWFQLAGINSFEIMF
jgi:hypothetical protein